jgi:hypothetical protein
LVTGSPAKTLSKNANPRRVNVESRHEDSRGIKSAKMALQHSQGSLVEVRQMTDAHRDALEEFLRVFDERSAAAPIVERRKPPPPAAEIVTARRARGPVDTELAYWVSPQDGKRH